MRYIGEQPGNNGQHRETIPDKKQEPWLVREREAARMLGVSVAALRRWRREGRGPVFVKMERCVGYRIRDLESYVNGNVVLAGK